VEVLSSRILLRPADLGRSRHFYRDVLGLAVYREFGAPGDPGVVFFLGSGFLEVSGHSVGTAGYTVMIWLQVRDVNAERLAAAGARIVREPVTEPWGLTEMWIEDPERPASVVSLAAIAGLPVALAGLLALIAAGTLAHTLASSTRRRRRDLAVLKTLGFTRRQLRQAVAWQATTIAAIALLVGLPVGVAAGRWAWRYLAAQLGVLPEPAVPLTAIIIAIPAALVVANLIAAVPGQAAARIQPAVVLRAE
jgi:predicted enzyme related to lactoylglutathione lyase